MCSVWQHSTRLRLSAGGSIDKTSPTLFLNFIHSNKQKFIEAVSSGSTFRKIVLFGLQCWKGLRHITHRKTEYCKFSNRFELYYHLMKFVQKYRDYFSRKMRKMHSCWTLEIRENVCLFFFPWKTKRKWNLFKAFPWNKMKNSFMW